MPRIVTLSIDTGTGSETTHAAPHGIRCGTHPGKLVHRDVLAWSEHQADLLRRVGRGEPVNDIDWEFVAEEIADVGLSELHAVESFLELILAHLIKIHGWPDSPSVRHWWSKVVTLQRNMRRRFAPSMRQRLATVYAAMAFEAWKLRHSRMARYYAVAACLTLGFVVVPHVWPAAAS